MQSQTSNLIHKGCLSKLNGDLKRTVIVKNHTKHKYIGHVMVAKHGFNTLKKVATCFTNWNLVG